MDTGRSSKQPQRKPTKSNSGQAWKRAHPERALELQRRWRRNNREYKNEQARKWLAANPDKVALYKANKAAKQTASERRSKLMRRYNLTEAQFDAMIVSQQGRCAICDAADPNLHVDHCHRTGKVRGLLCARCNHGIGELQDSVELLRRAMEYLAVN